jgi:hypothetical protein
MSLSDLEFDLLAFHTFNDYLEESLQLSICLFFIKTREENSLLRYCDVRSQLTARRRKTSAVTRRVPSERKHVIPLDSCRRFIFLVIRDQGKATSK